MRVTPLFIVLLSLYIVRAQEGEGKNASPQQEQQEIPTTVAEAHAELERILSAEMLAEIDAMPSEDGMAHYHMDVGLYMRNSWGLWAGGPLARHMQELGFTHPDIMSGEILATFWCRRHGQDFCMKERGAAYQTYLEDAKKAEEEEKRRIQQAKAMIPGLMMGLSFEKRDVPRVEILLASGMGVCFMCPFRDGVFLSARCQGRIDRGFRDAKDRRYADPPDGEIRKWLYYDDNVVRGFYYDLGDTKPRKMKPGDDFYIQALYLDPADRTIHRIRVPEVEEVYAAVVAGGRAWFAGLTNGKAVLVGIRERDRIMGPLPQEDEVHDFGLIPGPVGNRDRVTLVLPQNDEIPDLGMDGQSLLAVYSKAIYRLTDGTWTLLYSGDILLPRSVLPPQRHANMVFLRDRGLLETHKRLWWLTLGEQWNLRALDRDVGMLAAWGPYWGEVLSYSITSSGDLWACVGGWNAASLVRRSKDGSYAIAILKGRLRFSEDLPDTRQTDQRLSVSAVTALPDDTLLLAGRSGLYRLKGNELVQELAFAACKTPNRLGTFDNRGDWTPSHVLMLDNQSYVISTALWDGLYLLRKGIGDQWSCLPLDDGGSGSVVW